MHDFAIRAARAVLHKFYWLKNSNSVAARAKTKEKKQKLKRVVIRLITVQCVSVTNSIVSNRQIERGYRPNQYGLHTK